MSIQVILYSPSQHMLHHETVEQYKYHQNKPNYNGDWEIVEICNAMDVYEHLDKIALTYYRKGLLSISEEYYDYLVEKYESEEW